MRPVKEESQSQGFHLKGVVLGLAACLIALEILLRLFPFARLRLEPQYFYQPHAVLGWQVAPNTRSIFSTTEYRTPVQINSDGFRDKDYGPQHENIFRILGLGGSFTFGYGVDAEKSYLKLLEQKLNSGHSAPVFEVLNMGVPSYSFLQNAELLKEKGLKYRPDLILVSLIVTDPANSVQPEYSVYEGYLLQSDSLKNPFLKQKLSLYKHIKTLHFFAKILDRVKVRVSNMIEKRQTQYETKRQRAYQEGLSLIERQLLELKQWCRENHISLAVMFIPHRSQIHSEKFRAGSYASYFDFDQKLREICGKEKVPYVDLLPGLKRDAAKGRMLYFNIDGHWNKNGHEAAAKILFDQLTQQQILAREEPAA